MIWPTSAACILAISEIKQLTYQPLVELIRYLEAHDFKVFIVSVGG